MGRRAGRPCGTAGSRFRLCWKGCIWPINSYSSRNMWVQVRTSTRPPPFPTSAPCPYRTGPRHSFIRLSKFIRTINERMLCMNWTLNAVYLPVHEMNKALTFYRDQVGLEESWREGDLAMAFLLPETDVQLIIGQST